MKRFGRFASVCMTAAVLLAAPFAHAQVLDQVPSDAMVVVKFNKLKAVSDKIGAMGQKLGIAAFVPQLSDPLGAMKQKGNIQNGMDDNGEAAFVFINGPAAGQKAPALLLLLPVTDYKAFLGNFTDAKTEGDVSEMHFGGDSDLSYAANWGNYAVISPQKELVSKKPTGGLKASGMAAKELEEKDIVAFVNMKGAREKILPQMDKAKADFLKDFEKNYANGMAGGQPGMRRNAAAPAAPAAPDPQAMKYMPLAKSLMSRLFDVAEQAVRDADSATWGVSITPDGLKFTGLSEFTAASQSAQAAATFKGSDDSMLAGLPQAKYLAFGGMQLGDSAGVAKLLTDFLAPVETQITALGSDGKPVQDYIDAITHYITASKANTTGMLTPTGALGQDAIFQMISVATGDSKAMLDAQMQMATSQQAFMDIFAMPQMRGMMKSTVTPAAKTIDGVTFNQVQMQVVQPAGKQNAQMMQMKQMMNWMYGPNGMGGLIGAVGADKVIGLMGAKEDMASQLIASAKSNEDVLSKSAGVAAVQKELPKSRVFTGYFALDQFATTVAGYAKMFGLPVNFQLPADLPPIGFSAATEGTAVRADAYIPAQLLQSVIAAGIQSYMQMQGGQQPGGPGGL